MKNILVWRIAIGAAAALMAGIVLSLMWFGRFASDAITSIEVIQAEPGVRCAKMLTTEGAAISCWRTQ